MKAQTRLLTVACALLAACSCASGSENDWIRRVDLANHLVETGDLEQALTIYAIALGQARAAGDNVCVAVVLQNLGRVLDRKGQLLDAEKAYLQAIHSLKRADSADDRLLLRASASLTAVYLQTGQFSKAERLIKETLAAHPVGVSSDKASLMGNLGVVLAHKQQFAEAEHTLLQTADACADDPDAEMREVGAVAVANLAGLQMRAGRTADAVASYRQALAAMEALANPAPATFSAALAGYAKALCESGDRKTAGILFLRAIAVAEMRLGRNHVVIAGLLQDYAQLVRREGRKSEARKLEESARRIQSEWNRENMTGQTVEVRDLLRQTDM